MKLVTLMYVFKSTGTRTGTGNLSIVSSWEKLWSIRQKDRIKRMPTVGMDFRVFADCVVKWNASGLMGNSSIRVGAVSFPLTDSQ